MNAFLSLLNLFCYIVLLYVNIYRYVALVPQTEDEHGNDGFCIIHLPMESKCFILENDFNIF